MCFYLGMNLVLYFSHQMLLFFSQGNKPIIIYFLISIFLELRKRELGYMLTSVYPPT